jgi:peroxiredoxin Q/BCP
MNVDVGALAPDFDLENDMGKPMSLDDFANRWLVLYFYPRDNTPGCTLEAQAFTQALDGLRKAGAEVVGVSRDSVLSHGSFRDKFDIRFPLLSDPELSAHAAYGAWGQKMMYGKQVEGTIRSTFLIAPDGHIARVWRGVKVAGHADAIAAALAELGSAAALPAPATNDTAPKGSSPTAITKRPPAKKAAAEKGAASRAPAKKAPTKKAPTKKAPAKKTAAKKAPAKKTAAKKAPARKGGASRAPAKKAAAGKVPAKKAPAKKTAAKKATAGKKKARRP